MSRKLLILFAITAIILCGCSNTENQADAEGAVSEPDAVSVAVMQASAEDISVLMKYSGKIVANDTIPVTSKLSGKIASVLFDVGDRVSEDALMLTIDDTDLQAQVAATQAQYDLAVSNYNRTTGGSVELSNESLKLQIANAERAVENAERALESSERAVNTAKTNHTRQQELFSAGAISKIELEAAENQLIAAESQYDATKSQLDAAKDQLVMSKTTYDLNTTKILSENESASKAQVATAKVAVDNALTSLSNTLVRAPISGVISACTVSPGMLISPSVSAFTIVDDNTVYLEFGVTEDMVNSLSVGTEVTLEIPAANISGVSGTISSIPPSANSRTQLYDVRVTINNSEHTLKPGMFATAGIVTQSAKGVIAVPVDALLSDDDGDYVYVVENRVAKRRGVTLGITDDERVVIKSGLTLGESVVIKGQNFISDGTPVDALGGV